MSNDLQLTRGAIRSICTPEAAPLDELPVVQVMAVKKITKNELDRYRVVLSDGEHFQQAMLVSTLNHLVDDGDIRTNAVVRLREYTTSTLMPTRKVIIVVEIDVVDAHVGALIGAPTDIDKASGDAAAGAAVAAATESTPAPVDAAPLSGGRARGGATGSIVTASRIAPARAATGVTRDDSQYLALRVLSPYVNHWTVKVRVTKKGTLRTYQNARGAGKLLSFDVIDRAGDEMRVTCFNDVADRMQALVRENRLYTISRATLKAANKQYNSFPHPFEMTLDRDSEVVELPEDATIAVQKLQRTRIADVATLEAKTSVDVVGFVLSVGSLGSVTTTRTQQQLEKRTVQIADEIGASVELTLWGELAHRLGDESPTGVVVLVVKRATVGDFGGRSLSTSFAGTLLVNPDMPEVAAVRAWVQQKGGVDAVRGSLKSMSAAMIGGGGAAAAAASAAQFGRDPLVQLGELESRKLGHGEKPDYFEINGSVSYIRHDSDNPPWYKAAPDSSQKVTEDTVGGGYRTADGRMYESYRCRYILKLVIVDDTGSAWFSTFDEQATQLLGTPAHDLEALLRAGDTEAFNRVFAAALNRPYRFRCRARMEEQRGGGDGAAAVQGPRVAYTIQALAPVDAGERARSLLAEISQFA